MSKLEKSENYYSSTQPYRICFIGPPNVGKLSIITRYIKEKSREDSFIDILNTQPTKEDSYTTSVVKILRKDVTFQLADSSGDDKFRGEKSKFYDNCMGVVIVVDGTIGMKENVRIIKEKIEEVKKLVKDEERKLKIMVLLNKMDLGNKRNFWSELKKIRKVVCLQKRIKTYLEAISAFSGRNVGKGIDFLLHRVHFSWVNEVMELTLKIGDNYVCSNREKRVGSGSNKIVLSSCIVDEVQCVISIEDYRKLKEETIKRMDNEKTKNDVFVIKSIKKFEKIDKKGEFVSVHNAIREGNYAVDREFGDFIYCGFVDDQNNCDCLDGILLFKTDDCYYKVLEGMFHKNKIKEAQIIKDIDSKIENHDEMCIWIENEIKRSFSIDRSSFKDLGESCASLRKQKCEVMEITLPILESLKKFELSKNLISNINEKIRKIKKQKEIEMIKRYL